LQKLSPMKFNKILTTSKYQERFIHLIVQGLSRNRRLRGGASFSQALFPILFMIGIRVQTLLFLALDSSPAWAEGGKDLVYKP